MSPAKRKELVANHKKVSMFQAGPRIHTKALTFTEISSGSEAFGQNDMMGGKGRHWRREGHMETVQT